MAAWFVFVAVVFTLVGPMVWMIALSYTTAAVEEGADELSESAAWWQLIGPIVAGAPVLAFMVGWVLQEPNQADELISVALMLPAALFTFAVLRALVRAGRSAALARDVHMPIGTVGLIRPRVVVSKSFGERAPQEVLAAALAHEAAHVRGRDPLRIWLAQFAADLQWPIPNARMRLRRWVLALELLRDDEAISAGASPVALAEGLLLAAELTTDPRAQTHHGPVVAAAIGRRDGLAIRVRRLLADAAGRVRRGSTWLPWLACGAVLALCIVLGAQYGDEIIVTLPGVSR